MTKFKKFLTCTSAVAVTMLAVATFAQTASACTYPIRGDVNNDGKVNVCDVAALQRCLKGNRESSITNESADVDRNGSINTIDFTTLQSITLGDDKAYFTVNGSNKVFGENKIFLDNGTYFGIMQGDGNVVIYKRDGSNTTPVFNTGTNKNASSFKNHQLVFQADGNIVLYATRKSDNQVVARWDSGTYYGKDGMYMAYLNNDGLLEWTTKDIMAWSSDSNFIANETARARKRIENHYKYSTPLNAAVDFIHAYNRESIEACTEYGATIEVHDDYYVLTDTKISDDIRRDRSNGDGPKLGFGPYDVAWVHTHGINFCDNNSRFSEVDLDIADLRNSVAYLGAPNGEIWRYAPKVDVRSSVKFQSGKCIGSRWYKDPRQGAR